MREAPGGRHYSRFKMFLLSSSSTAGLWLSRLRKNTRITFCTMVAAGELHPGSVRVRVAGAPPEDRLPKNGRGEEEGEEVGGPPSEAASCWQIESDPRAGGRWPSVTGRLGQPALPLPLRTSSSSCPDLLPARQAGRLPRRGSGAAASPASVSQAPSDLNTGTGPGSAPAAVRPHPTLPAGRR